MTDLAQTVRNTDKCYRCISDGRSLHLKVKDASILPDYLTLVLKFKIVRLQAERSAGGSIIQHWKLSKIEQTLIPLLPLPVQRQIASLVQKSLAFRTESKRLLKKAKSLVETAIEQGKKKQLSRCCLTVSMIPS